MFCLSITMKFDDLVAILADLLFVLTCGSPEAISSPDDHILHSFIIHWSLINRYYKLPSIIDDWWMVYQKLQWLPSEHLAICLDRKKPATDRLRNHHLTIKIINSMHLRAMWLAGNHFVGISTNCSKSLQIFIYKHSNSIQTRWNSLQYI